MSYDPGQDYRVSVWLALQARIDPAKQRLVDAIRASKVGCVVGGDFARSVSAAAFFTRQVLAELTALGYRDGSTAGFELAIYSDADLPESILKCVEVWKNGLPAVQMQLVIKEGRWTITRFYGEGSGASA